MSNDDQAELFRLLVENAKDYAIFTMDQSAHVTTWNPGAERLLGWPEPEAIGMRADLIFTPEDRAQGEPDRERQTALATGRAQDDRWHMKKDGSRFCASGV